MVSADGSGLVFIISSPRSGSTLLSAVLDGHPEILSPPEPWFLLPLVGLRDQRVVMMAPFDYQTAQHVIQDTLSPELFNKAINAFAITAYNSLLELGKKRIFVDKTPPYYQILPSLNQLFPNSSKIWIRRNPLDVIASCKDTWNRSVSQLMGSPVDPLTFSVTISFLKMHEFFKKRLQNHCMISYENFVSNPTDTVKIICDLIGVKFYEEMLKYGDNTSAMARFGRAKAGDRKLLGHKSLHSESVERWRFALTPEEVSSVLETLGTETFTALGYADQLDEAVHYSRMDQSRLTRRGRLDVLLDIFERYAQAVVEGSAVDPVYDWLQAVNRAKMEIANLVPEGDSFILVDGDEWATEESLAGRQRIPFLERDGRYWGPPEDDATAINELDKRVGAGASFIVFGWPAFWWLEHYVGLRQKLRSEFRCVLENDRVVVFDLRRPGRGS